MNAPKHRPRRRFRYLFAGLLFGSAAVVILAQAARMHVLSSEFWNEIFRMGQVMSIVNRTHVDEGTSTYPAMGERALREMVNGLDRHSRWMSNEEASAFEESFHQQYSGIGVRIRPVDKGLEITEVFGKSPAAKAGLRRWDIIVSAAGTPLEGLGSREATDLIKGPAGSPVRLEIERPGEPAPLPFTVRRGDIPVENVRNVRMERPGIGVVEIDQFGEKTAANFARALTRLEDQGMRGLILDLRGNPGGSLTSAVEVAGEFLPKGTVVVSTRGREENANHVFRSESEPRLRSYPLVVLVDSGSASASEIVAGALQEEASAVVVGERTVGKGSVQSYIPLENGEAIKLTTARWYLPSGKAVEDNGVIPDVKVSVPPAQRASLFMQRIHDGAGELSDEEFLELFGFARVSDPQMEAAIDILTAAAFAGVN